MGAVLDSLDHTLVRGMGQVPPLTAGLSLPWTLDWTAQLCLDVGPLLFSLGPGLSSSALAEMGLHSFSSFYCLSFFYLFSQCGVVFDMLPKDKLPDSDPFLAQFFYLKGLSHEIDF